ncbi:vanillate O-demethylase ferredoxin subunit [Saccharopolyspora antimicrobica]|uniref:Vanillate O-demethylase ferredoxin subunit n=1 Tax=Saccharopolyspora antimicrobica TaxID=455193 RepID=A0A1I5K691_9PSEU|nr:PDR/VanB family oxidoreductase [Saccharopolyspora antimicrobica]RKT84809.1 vanillate O-demethylase ferredoxin subunit [Saccharopolyspora antimicrobica]SFO80263.1 vanillate O-demethylase ferredoxin subunit [Saccharopolyspora antimicrobica]
MKVEVVEIVEAAAGIRALRLARADGAPFEAHRAGAHVDVTGPTGVLRQYSLCGPPDDRKSLLIAVKREPDSRGGSAALHAVAVGDHLEVGPPRNLLALAEDADHHVLVAGGIGVTPLLSMAHELRRTGAAFELHYFARSRAKAAFVDLLESDFGANVHFGVPRAEQPALFAGIAAELTPAAHVYTCGPEGFMEQVTEAFAPSVGADHVHVEHFTAAEVDTSADAPFTVELDTGEVFEVPADRSILSVLEEGGIDVAKSCEEGICGSCVSGVLDGVPDHRDNCLSSSDKAAGDQMALCVSRALTDKLVIELY